MISGIVCDVLDQKAGRKKGMGCLLIREFHLGDHKGGKGRIKNVQFNGQGRELCRRCKIPGKNRIFNGDQVAGLGDHISVCLFLQVSVGGFV